MTIPIGLSPQIPIEKIQKSNNVSNITKVQENNNPDNQVSNPSAFKKDKDSNVSDSQTIKKALEYSFNEKQNSGGKVELQKVKDLGLVTQGISKLKDLKLTGGNAPETVDNVKTRPRSNTIIKTQVEDNLPSASGMIKDSGKNLSNNVSAQPKKLSLLEKIKKKFGPSANKVERAEIKSKLESIAGKYSFGLSKEEKASKMAEFKNAIKEKFSPENMKANNEAIKHKFTKEGIQETGQEIKHKFTKEGAKETWNDVKSVGTKVGDLVSPIKDPLMDVGVPALVTGVNGALTGVGIKTAKGVFEDLKKDPNLVKQEHIDSSKSAAGIAGGAGGVLGGTIGLGIRGISIGLAVKNAVTSGLEAKDFDRMAVEFKKDLKNVNQEIKNIDKVLKHIKNPESPKAKEFLAKKEELMQSKEVLKSSIKEAKAFSKEIKLIVADASIQAIGNGTALVSSATGVTAQLTATIAGGVGNTAVQATASVVGAAASGVTGVVDMALGGYAIAKDGISFAKNAKLKIDASNFDSNPPKALEIRFEKKMKTLEKDLAKTEKQIAKAIKENKPTAMLENKKALLETSISKLKPKLEEAKLDALIFEKASDKGKLEINKKYGYTDNLAGIAEQTITRRNLGFKALSITNNVVKVTGGAVTTGGTIATATGVGAPVGAVMTPVGYSLSGISAAGGVGLGIFKTIKTAMRVKKAEALNKELGKAGKLINNLENKLNATNEKLEALQKANPKDPGIKALQDEKNSITADLKEVNSLKNRIQVQMSKKSPDFAVNALVATLNKKAPPNASSEEKNAVKAEVRMVKAMLKNIYGVDPKTLLSEVPKGINQNDYIKLQKKSIKVLQNKIQYFA